MNVHKFGGCPECHDNEGYYYNIGRYHWIVCHEHRTKWCIGPNRFPYSENDSFAVWSQNQQTLLGYCEVRPWFPEPWDGEEYFLSQAELQTVDMEVWGSVLR